MRETSVANQGREPGLCLAGRPQDAGRLVKRHDGWLKLCDCLGYLHEIFAHALHYEQDKRRFDSCSGAVASVVLRWSNPP